MQRIRYSMRRGGAVAFGLISLAGSLQAAPPVMRDAATHDQLSARLRREVQVDPMSRMVPAKGADPSVVNRPDDILNQSEILCFGGFATLVPKRALLGVAAKFKDRTVFKDGARVVPWSEFYARNRSWLTTVEVSPDEAGGRAQLPDPVLRQVAECGEIVVATYLGGPISVLEYKPVSTTDNTRK